ncbi:MAG: glycosyltransferase family 4 protein [Bacilli bacterium]|nr:glycosyltransferase family 4 protein [Bacilli bacterium]
MLKKTIKKIYSRVFYISTFFKIKKINNKNKKCLLVSHDFSLSGAPLMLLNIYEYLRSQGFYVILVANDYGKMIKELRRRKIPHIVIYDKDEKLWKKVLSFDYECIFLNTIKTLFVLNFVDLSSKRCISWIHEGTTYIDNEKVDIDLSNVRLFFVSNWSLNCAKRILNIKNYQLLHYGIKNNSSKYIYNNKNNNFVIVGQICARKNQNYVINEYLKLDESFKKVHNLVIVGKLGDDLYGEEFTTLVKQNNEFVKYKGELSHDEVLNVISQSSVLICASVDDPLPVVVTEALMMRTIVIVSNNVGHYEMIHYGKNGFTFNLNDSLSLKKAFINSSIATKEVLEEGYKLYLQYFTLDKFYHQLEKGVFYDIIKK